MTQIEPRFSEFSTNQSTDEDEESPLIKGTPNGYYGNDSRIPRLKEIASSHRDSTESVDVEVNKKPPKFSLAYKVMLITVLVISGSAMTLCMKNQDQTCIANCEPPGNGTGNFTDGWITPNAGWGLEESDVYQPELVGGFFYPGRQVQVQDNSADGPEYFHQPFFQLFHLGLGQVISGIFTPFFGSTEPGLQPIPFKKFFPQAALASVFDVTAEVLIIIGLSLTFASVTEMLKTTMVVFVGLLSLYFFPGFSINWKQWVASGFMMAGALLVILQNFLTPGADTSNLGSEIGGAFLVIAAQLFYGLEFVVEEKLIDHSKIKGLHVNKAKLVFSLGLLSMTFASVLQLPWTAITSDFVTLGHDFQLYFEIRSLWLSGIGISMAVMGFDLAGLGISEVMGSDRRAIVVAAFQVAIVWGASIWAKWESFSFLSLGGFLIILVSGAVYVFTSKEKSEPHQERKKMKSPA